MNELTLSLLDGNGNIINQQTTHNDVLNNLKQLTKVGYLASSGMHTNFYYGNGRGQVANATLYLYDSLGTITPDGLDVEDYGNTTGICAGTTATNQGTAGGVYLPSAVTIPEKGKIKHVWEWATSQGNGTINSIGIRGGMTGSGTTNAILEYFAPNLNLTRVRYIGYKKVGLDTHLYYRKHDTSVNNILVLNEANFQTLETKSLNITGEPSNYNDYYSRRFTCFAPNGNFYTLKSVSYTSTGSLILGKADETGLTYGADIDIPFTLPSGSTILGNNRFMLTCDDNFLYVFFQCSGNSPLIFKISLIDDQLVEIIDWDGAGGDNVSLQFFNVCPFDGRIYYSPSSLSDRIYSQDPALFSTTTKGTLETYFSNYLPDMAYSNGGEYLKTIQWADYTLVGSNLVSNSNWSFNSIPYGGGVVCRNFKVKSDFLTFANLTTPIIKTSANSLRLEYTMTVF